MCHHGRVLALITWSLVWCALATDDGDAGLCNDHGDKDCQSEDTRQFEETFEYGLWLGRKGREGLPYTDQHGLGIQPGECTIQRRSLDSLSLGEFASDFLARGRPVMLVEAAQSLKWAGLQQWTSIEAVADL